MATPSSSILRHFRRLNLSNSGLPFVQTRAASHASQGTANRGARGPGKRLGAKKGASEPVVPGNIIFRQRGSLWFPGENCVMGRDHTISSLQKGFVRYYRDPARHPKRKFIGVVFQQNESLPRPLNAPRRRRLGMTAVPRALGAEMLGQEAETGALQAEDVATAPAQMPEHSPRYGYRYRMSNTEIGRIGQRVREKLKNENRRKKKLVNLRKRSQDRGLEALQVGASAKKGKGRKAKGRKM